jgi:hypothetical protein
MHKLGRDGVHRVVGVGRWWQELEQRETNTVIRDALFLSAIKSTGELYEKFTSMIKLGSGRKKGKSLLFLIYGDI